MSPKGRKPTRKGSGHKGVDPLNDPVAPSISLSRLGRVFEVLVEDGVPGADVYADHLKTGGIGAALRHAGTQAKQQYASATEHFVANQLALLVKKYPFTPDEHPADRKGAALSKFLRTERRCRLVNRVIDRREFFTAPDSLGVVTRTDRLTPLFGVMQRWIRYVLGEEAPLHQVYQEARFNLKAAVGFKRPFCSVLHKTAGRAKWTVTRPALSYFIASLRQDAQAYRAFEDETGFSGPPGPASEFATWVRARCRVIDYNNISTVPKDAEIDRTMASGPLANLYLQLGVDAIIKRRLLRVGLDLTDQSRNQELARQGSLDEEDGYVTIDLRSASDTVSVSTVRYLLKLVPSWYRLLSDLRETHGQFTDQDGVKHRIVYEKFCAMGNGFCFSLESLLFAAACHAAYSVSPPGDQSFSVYGDDIVVRKRVVGTLLPLLRAMGFVVNTDKSFLKGPFRESCGADWYSGSAVRPVTLDYRLETIPDLVKFHNATLRRDRTSYLFDRVREEIRSWVPPSLRFVRPFKGSDDTCFEVPYDVFLASPHSRWNKVCQHWVWKEYRPTTANDNVLLAELTGRRSGAGELPSEFRGQYAGWVMREVLRGSSLETLCPLLANKPRYRVRWTTSAWGTPWVPTQSRSDALLYPAVYGKKR